MRFLPDILVLQLDLVKMFQNMTELNYNTIGEFLQNQKAGTNMVILVMICHGKVLSHYGDIYDWSMIISLLLIISVSLLMVDLPISAQIFSAVMQAYAISLIIKFTFIANIMIVPYFHSTASLTAWYEKRIKIFISTWNQIRVSLATTGKPSPTYDGKHKFVKITGFLH